MSSITLGSLAHADPKILSQGSVKSTDSPEKIKDAAQQFEGLLLAQMLSSIHEGGGWLGSSDQSSGATTGFAEQQLAGLIAQKGGLGLSTMIAHGLTRQSSAGAEAPAELSAVSSQRSAPESVSSAFQSSRVGAQSR
jgi:Rod binding domain-containing protein